MADEFHGLSGTWWSSMRCSNLLAPPDSCFGWSNSSAAAAANAGFYVDNSPASCVTFQESHAVQPSDHMAGMPDLDSSLQLSMTGLSSSSVDHQWAQSFIAESSEPYYANYRDLSYGFPNTDPSSSKSAMANNNSLFSPSELSLPCNLLEFEAKHRLQNHSVELLSIQQRNFSSNNAAFNNGSSDFCSLKTGFVENSGFNKSTEKLNSEETVSSSHSSRSKKSRIEKPSPLPAFKVRKEKLGDRITALQQLVSPFGKTDTASVLYEAIEYIKFLHEQVRTLSVPYLRNDSQINHQRNSERSKEGESSKQQLRSRGLCLVPVSSTSAVACSEIPPMDFWTPAFGMISYI